MAKDKKPPRKPVGTGLRNGRETRVYEDGLEMYSDNGRIAVPAERLQITPESSIHLQRIRRLKKQDAILSAANAGALLDAAQASPAIRDIVGYDDMAAVRAMTLGRMRAAMDSDNPYGNGAASWIMQESGLGERQQDAAQDTGQASDLVLAVAALVRAITDRAEGRQAVTVQAVEAGGEGEQENGG